MIIPDAPEACPYTPLGLTLRILRDRRGMTQAELGRRLGRARWRTSRIAKQLAVEPSLVRVHVGHLVDDRPLGYGRPPATARAMEAA